MRYGNHRQSDRRFETQEYLERNYLPNMLGWFMITSTTTLEDIEWMMARAAGYNAGFALVMRLPELQQNQNTDELLDVIKTWEQARLAGMFSPDQRQRLKNPSNEFRLEKKGGDSLILYAFETNFFQHKKRILQPGEPTDSEWSFTSKIEGYPLQFRMTLKGKEGKVVNPELEHNHSFLFSLPKELQAGWSLVCDGTRELKIFDSEGRFLKVFNMKKEPPKLSKGGHDLRFNCDFAGADELMVDFVVRQRMEGEQIGIIQ